jgi:hypothetical protein
MPKKLLATTIILATILTLVVGMQVEVATANPTWGTSATPIPPITDPPQIIINSPTPTEYNNPVPLNITIIQPDSWLTNHTFVLPNSYADNSDSVVVGQNKLKSITCIIDGQSVVLWNGTLMGSSEVIKAVTYYLPRITQFSAIMNLSKGQHNLQVNVIAVSDYVIEGIIPFAQKEYIISANHSTTFRVEDGSDAPMIDFISSSYVIWQSSSDSMPSPTSAPQSLNPPQNPTTSPTSNSNHPPSPTQTIYPTPSPTLSQSMPTINTGPTLPVELNPPVIYIVLAIVIVIVAVGSVSLVYFKRRKGKP